MVDTFGEFVEILQIKSHLKWDNKLIIELRFGISHSHRNNYLEISNKPSGIRQVSIWFQVIN